MKEIGKILKQTRENKKLSVTEIHKITKIKESYIVALENDDISGFPAELYYKNFLKNYAKFLNLKADELLINYESAKKEEQKNDIKEQIQQNTNGNRKLQKKLVITLIIAVIMCAVLIVFEFLLTKTSTAVQYLEDVQISTNTVLKKTEIPPQIIKQKLVINTVGPTWLIVDVDNKKAFEGTVYKGGNKIFYADNSFVLKIGNVSNASVYFNDKTVDIISGASKNNVNNITLTKAEEKTLE